MSFFLLFMYIIGLAQNTDAGFVRYCFLTADTILQTMTTSIYAANNDLNLIVNYSQFRIKYPT